MKRRSIALALLGVGEHERRVLAAAINTVSGPALDADVHWSKLDLADVVIADVDHPNTVRTLEGLREFRSFELIRFAPQGRADVDLARPIRMQALIELLQRATENVVARERIEARAVAAAAAQAHSTRRTYRGAALAAPDAAPAPEAPEAKAEVSVPVRPRRTYRGQTY